MQTYLGRAIALGLLACGAGCGQVSTIQPVATQFDQGAHSLVTSEESLFQALRTTDCSSEFYAAAASYAAGKGPLPALNSPCTPAQLTDKELQIRQGVLQAISLYADKIEAVAGSTNTTIDAGAQTLASGLNTRFSGADKSTASGVESAIIELANIALDARRTADIRSAATAASAPLKTVVALLKTENTDFGAAIDGNIGSVDVNLNTILRHEHGPQAFFDAAQARTILATQQSADSSVAKLNAALDALVKANDALAAAGNGGIVEAVNELVARANDAQSIYAALNKPLPGRN